MNDLSKNSAGFKTEQWYTRPIFSVADIETSLDFYCNQLGFSQGWDYKEDGKTIVTQVNKGTFELILTMNLDRVGMSRVFISLEANELEVLEDKISIMQIPYKRGFWGYPVIILDDPDGNQLLFPLEDSDNSE